MHLEIDGILILDMEIFKKSGQKIEGPVILPLSEKLGQNRAQSVNSYFKICNNSFVRVMADTPTPPAYPGVYWIWLKNLPVSGTGHPTPGFCNLAHLSQSSKMLSIHIMFSALVFLHIRAKNF